jgi:hypothetical protein
MRYISDTGRGRKRKSLILIRICLNFLLVFLLLLLLVILLITREKGKETRSTSGSMCEAYSIVDKFKSAGVSQSSAVSLIKVGFLIFGQNIVSSQETVRR